jgi:hypothetical protein
MVDDILRATQPGTNQVNPGFADHPAYVRLERARIVSGDGETGYTVEQLSTNNAVTATITRVFPLAQATLAYLPNQSEPALLVASNTEDAIFSTGCFAAFTS